MREAVENLLNELDFPEPPAEPASTRDVMRLPPAPVYEQAVHPYCCSMRCWVACRPGNEKN